MRVKPIFKTEHQALKEEINKRMDDVKSGMKELVKQVIEDKDSGIDKNIETIIEKKLEDGSKTPGSKLSKMIDVIKEKKGGSGSGDDIVDCPTCHKGHVHAMVTGAGDGKKHDGVSYKCTGPGCGKEYIMVDKSADYKCANCNAPIKKPTDDNVAAGYDGCPFCHGKKAVKFDWNKVWSVTK